CHEAEEQDQRGVFARQRALRFHASAKLLVESLNRVRGSQRLPLRFREAIEREEFAAAFSKARHHARAALGPRALESPVGGAGGGGGAAAMGGMEERMEVVANARERVLRSFTFEVAQFVDAAALTRGLGHTTPTARRNPPLPSMMASTGARNPRAARSSRPP